MSIYASFDASEPSQVASNKGWSDFGEWVDTLQVDDCQLLAHLWDHGWTHEVSSLADQLETAIKSSPPTDKTVATTADELLDLLHANSHAEVVTINNGLSEGDE